MKNIQHSDSSWKINDRLSGSIFNQRLGVENGIRMEDF